MPKEITRYKCDHCKKNYAHKSSAIAHEKICFFNREKRACPSCLHFNGNYYGPECSLNKFEHNDELPFTENIIYDCADWKYMYEVVEEDEY